MTTMVLKGIVKLWVDIYYYEELKMLILSFYHLDIEDYEYSETLIEDKEYNVEWWEELYMLSSDDAIVIMHPKSKED